MCLLFISGIPNQFRFGFHPDLEGSTFESKDYPRPIACQLDPSWIIAFFPRRQDQRRNIQW
jgi:hypothetical protein